MKFSLFPKEVQNLKLNISKDILIKELSSQIDFGGSSQVWFNKKYKKFAGYSKGEKYNIKLKTSYRNSFKPRIYIEFYEIENVTEVKIEYKLEIAVKAMMIVFVSILSIVQILIIYFKSKKIFDGENYEYFFPAFMLFFLFLLSRLGFYTSMGQSKDTINKIFLIIGKKYSLIKKIPHRRK